MFLRHHKQVHKHPPQEDFIHIINNVLKNNIPDDRREEIIILVNAILSQNYLQLTNHQYRQNEGLAMGSPTSAILVEIFVQYLEQNDIISTPETPYNRLLPILR
jgi:hypothetical protein